jgi:hypothetical protein
METASSILAIAFISKPSWRTEERGKQRITVAQLHNPSFSVHPSLLAVFYTGNTSCPSLP